MTAPSWWHALKLRRRLREAVPGSLRPIRVYRRPGVLRRLLGVRS